MNKGEAPARGIAPGIGRPGDAYSLSTPYGLVTIANGGRSINFELFDDVRQSAHATALFGYVQRLIQGGVTRYNVDHLNIAGRDKSLDLRRGKARLDLMYESRGRLIECELKTRREIGLEATAKQLTELTKRCERLQLLVPRGCTEEAATVLRMINLDHKITIAPYDYVEETEDVPG